jgi:hypothetical protein
MAHTYCGDEFSEDLFDQNALDRIVAAPGLPLCTDHKSLHADLVECYRAWVLLTDFGRSPAKRGIEGIKRLREWATEGTKLLGSDENDQDYVRELWANHGGSYPPLLPQIKRLGDLLEQVKLEAVDYTGSSVENLTGVLLPYVFEYHFRKAPKLSRDANTNTPSGPYIRFARQVCIEFEIQCSPETIASAMRRHRATHQKK